MQAELLNKIREQPAFKSLAAEIALNKSPHTVGLPSAVRLPVLAGLREH